MTFLDFLRQLLDRLFPASPPTPPVSPTPPAGPVGQKPAPVFPRVLEVIYNPEVPSEGGRRLREVLGWNDPDALMQTYINDLRETSAGYLNYTIVERLELDEFPVKVDGFSYTADAYVQAMRTRIGFHQPDAVDYYRILQKFNIPARVDAGEIDEVWLFAFPYAGFYESRMGGLGAFACNSPALTGSAAGTRRYIIMGFNYERGVGEMLESFGHRTEFILAQVFRNAGSGNLWQRYTRHEQIAPGLAEVGTIHFAPNSQVDYDWGNPRKVLSRCDTWRAFPNLSGTPRLVNSSEWGGGDTRLHHRWWLDHLPRVSGANGGIAYNWWLYIVDPNEVP